MERDQKHEVLLFNNGYGASIIWDEAAHDGFEIAVLSRNINRTGKLSKNGYKVMTASQIPGVLGDVFGTAGVAWFPTKEEALAVAEKIKQLPWRGLGSSPRSLPASLVRLSSSRSPTRRLIMYEFHPEFNSPNYTAGGAPLPRPKAILYWWGDPETNPSLNGVISSLCNPNRAASSQEIITAGHVYCIVPYDARAWTSGSWEADHDALTMECDPNRENREAIINTIVERLAYNVREGNLSHDFTLYGHKDFYNTACPGEFYPRLAEIRERVEANLNGQLSNQEENMSVETVKQGAWDALLQRMGASNVGQMSPIEVMVETLAIARRLEATLASQAAAITALASAKGVDPNPILNAINTQGDKTAQAVREAIATGINITGEITAVSK